MKIGFLLVALAIIAGLFIGWAMRSGWGFWFWALVF